MRAWLKALAFSRRAQLVTREFTANATVSIPVGTSRLESIVGKGAGGSPGYTQEGYSYRVTAESQQRRRSTGVWEVAASISNSGFSVGYPSSGCGPAISTPGDPTFDAVRSCSYYSNIRADTNEVPPSTGASAIGFGQTFVGGTGGPASTREVKNVAVTPGGSYQVVVPSGGSITISYYL